MSSLPGYAAKLLNAGHWQIEYSWCWALDVALREDASRIREDSNRENFAFIRRPALDLLKAVKPTKHGGANNDSEPYGAAIIPFLSSNTFSKGVLKSVCNNSISPQFR